MEFGGEEPFVLSYKESRNAKSCGRPNSTVKKSHSYSALKKIAYSKEKRLQQGLEARGCLTEPDSNSEMDAETRERIVAENKRTRTAERKRAVTGSRNARPSKREKDHYISSRKLNGFYKNRDGALA